MNASLVTVTPETAHVHLTFFHEIPFSVKAWKIDFAQVVPVTFMYHPDAWFVLSTIPHVEPDVANWRLGLVGPGCSACYSCHYYVILRSKERLGNLGLT